MTGSHSITLDCRTCPAVHTTACEDCVVDHLLANDAGPIEFVPSTPVDPCDQAVALFAQAGLLDDEPCFVTLAEFESAGAPQARGTLILRCEDDRTR